nr:unnamed protein product [Callosobruchus analis]
MFGREDEDFLTNEFVETGKTQLSLRVPQRLVRILEVNGISIMRLLV